MGLASLDRLWGTVSFVVVVASAQAAAAADAPVPAGSPNKLELSGSLTVGPPNPPKTGSGERKEVPAKCTLGTNRPAAEALLVLYSGLVEPVGRKCDQGAAYPTHPVVCLPLSSDEPTTLHRPNKTLDVWVVHADDINAPQYVSAISATPSASATPPEIVAASMKLNSVAAEAGPKLSFGVPESACVVETYKLAPRPPGAFTVNIQLNDTTGKVVPGSLRPIELVIEHEYVGAVRVGVGVSFPHDGVRSYSVRPTAAGTSAIYEDGHTLGTFEVVAGYSVYLFGRPTTTTLARFHLGWFSGLGLVSTSPSTGNLTYFTSLYTGPELSCHGVSLELLLGVRRGTALAEGFMVGSSVPAGSPAPTTPRFQFAPAIAVSFTSDVLKVAGVTVP